MAERSYGLRRWSLAIAALLAAGGYWCVAQSPELARGLGLDALLNIHVDDAPAVVDTEWYRCELSRARDAEDRAALRYHVSCTARVDLELRGLVVATRKVARASLRQRARGTKPATETLDSDRPFGAEARVVAAGERVEARGKLSAKGAGLTLPELVVEAAVAYPSEAARAERGPPSTRPAKFALRLRKVP